MGRSLEVAAGYRGVWTPDGQVYRAGDHFVLSSANYALVPGLWTGTILIDHGPAPDPAPHGVSAHAATHATGGTDPVSPASIGAGSGGGGGGTSYQQDFAAATTWTINHNLGFIPSVTCYASAGLGGGQIVGEVLSNNTTTTVVVFDVAVSGSANCS